MKRFHVHVAVENVDINVQFYSSLFGSQPTVLKDDYAKWMLEDPRINFAISKRTLTGKPGINHLGLQVDTDGELEEINTRISTALQPMMAEKDVDCCYAKSDKYWTRDPQGIAWESFRSLDTVHHYYGNDENAAATGASLLNQEAGSGCGTVSCVVSQKINQAKSRFNCC